MRASMSILASLALIATLLLSSTPASAHWRFGERLWIGYSVGQGWLLETDRARDVMSVYSRLGARITERLALEFIAGVSADTHVDKGGAGFALLLEYFPGVDWARLAVGPKYRIHWDDPRNAADRACTSKCNQVTSIHTSDVGLELGVSTQWNWGALYIGLDWAALYVPFVVVDGHELHFDGERRVGKNAIDVSAIDPSTELRLLNVAFGLTF